MNAPSRSELPVLTDKERLEAYNLLLAGCHHLWSKGKLQKEKVQKVLDTLVPLTKTDPYFLAHLTSYVVRKSTSHDMKLLTTFVNSLTSADGEPFSVGSEYKKPNLRIISAAAVQQLNPKEVSRLVDVAREKFSVADQLTFAMHFSRPLRKAVHKYLRYREANLDWLRGIKKQGMKRFYAEIYGRVNIAPSDAAAAVLRIPVKGRKIEFDKPLVDFTGLTPLQIAEKIQKDKINPFVAFGVLGQVKQKMTPAIAVAILEQCTGNQAVIMRGLFEGTGVLEDPEVKKLFEEKILTAKTALDRVATITKEASEPVKKIMEEARAQVRKEQVGDIGKIFVHVDFSPSMEGAIELAKEKTAIFAECVQNPAENFRWGRFDSYGADLPMPQGFVQDAFKAALFGMKITGGGTDLFALYPTAREFGATVDVFISDGGHNCGDLKRKIQQFHEATGLPKPSACVFIPTGNPNTTLHIKDGYEGNGIPIAIITPEALLSSAGVSEAVRMAMKGPMQIVEDIMKEPLLTLPEWYLTI